MLVRHFKRHRHPSRPGSSGRGEGGTTRATNIILVMLAALLVAVAAFKLISG
ncbi:MULTISPECIES: hypothetical protein [Rhizobium]|uniref:hypothetical protein n=1 Tax=Rhizobium TaxID=379 RepID=UPI0018855B44|nr:MULTISPECIES: hypothetical protein [Rhizobium]